MCNRVVVDAPRYKKAQPDDILTSQRMHWAIQEIMYAIQNDCRYGSINKQVLREYLQRQDAEGMFSRCQADLWNSTTVDATYWIDKFFSDVQQWLYTHPDYQEIFMEHIEA